MWRVCDDPDNRKQNFQIEVLHSHIRIVNWELQKQMRVREMEWFENACDNDVNTEYLSLAYFVIIFEKRET